MNNQEKEVEFTNDPEKEGSHGRVEFVGTSTDDKFATIEEFLVKIQEVQRKTSVQLWNRDYCTLEGTKRDIPYKQLMPTHA